MLNSLRRKLTISFVLMSLLIYCLAGVVATAIFAADMNSDLDNNLKRLLADVQPSVQLIDNRLSLKQWAENAQRQGLTILHIIQLYDKEGRFIAGYGRPGVCMLHDGPLEGMGLRRMHRFRSRYTRVFGAGYLQIQLETRQADESLRRFVVTMLMVLPVLAISTGFCGYLFAGHAVAPVGKSIMVLRQFVADAGHELNTPTTIIEASVQTLEDKLKESGQDTELVTVIGRASQRLRILSANLVLLARMESPELKLPMTRLMIDEFVEQTTFDFEEIAKSKGVKLSCLADTEATVSGHPDSLHHMLSNLIENAIRYTDSGGTVSVTASRQENTATITVADTGIGIPPASLERIFDRFYRVDKSRTRAQGGTGLGLSIVKAVIDAHHFAIRVESSEKQGSKFIVSMPCQPEPPRASKTRATSSGSQTGSQSGSASGADRRDPGIDEISAISEIS